MLSPSVKVNESDAGTCVAALAGGGMAPNVMFLVHFITTGEKGWDGSSESLPCKNRCVVVSQRDRAGMRSWH